MVLVLCTLLNEVLFVPSFAKISQWVSELLSGHDFPTIIFKRA